MEHTHKRKYWYAGALAAAFLALFLFVTFKYVYQARRANDELIADHIAKLHTIFTDINNSCKILGFRHEKEYIDFLNVAAFEGSEVGPMNLLEPKNWNGPYLKQNLTIEGIEYQIVSTKRGYYIIPGDGVVLANGKVIGKTLQITADSDIDASMRDPKELNSNGRPLAARIETYQTAHETASK